MSCCLGIYTHLFNPNFYLSGVTISDLLITALPILHILPIILCWRFSFVLIAYQYDGTLMVIYSYWVRRNVWNISLFSYLNASCYSVVRKRQLLRLCFWWITSWGGFMSSYKGISSFYYQIIKIDEDSDFFFFSS